MSLLKILIMVFFLCVGGAPLWAQEGRATLKDLAVGKIYQYAVALYDRGNYPEAGKAFNHILLLDPQYKPAIAYMHKLGLAVEERAEISAPIPDKTVLDDQTTPSPVPSGSNADVRARIAHEEQAIAQLKTELPVLRAGAETIPQ